MQKVIAYHGTMQKFDRFDYRNNAKCNYFGQANYFTTEKESAKKYASKHFDRYKGQRKGNYPIVFTCELKLINSFDLDNDILCVDYAPNRNIDELELFSAINRNIPSQFKLDEYDFGTFFGQLLEGVKKSDLRYSYIMPVHFGKTLKYFGYDSVICDAYNTFGGWCFKQYETHYTIFNNKNIEIVEAELLYLQNA